MFDAVYNASDLLLTDAYYDCMEHIERDTTLEPKIVLPWLEYLEQHNQVHHVHCVIDSTSDIMCPIPCSYKTMLTGEVDLLRTTNTTLPVIFDSVTSKAIRRFNEYFVDDIVDPPRELHLDGMDDEILIEGTW